MRGQRYFTNIPNKLNIIRAKKMTDIVHFEDVIPTASMAL